MRNRASRFLLPLAAILAGCDPNGRPTYNASTGLPTNCRAIIQANIDGWKAKRYTAEDAFDSIERNCGANGHSWGK
jgi:hypothetical protein